MGFSTAAGGENVIMISGGSWLIEWPIGSNAISRKKQDSNFTCFSQLGINSTVNWWWME
jgi:hypothetical protein